MPASVLLVALSVTVPVIWPPTTIAALIPDVVAPAVTPTGSAVASEDFPL
jgi:hypothetical protein